MQVADDAWCEMEAVLPLKNATVCLLLRWRKLKHEFELHLPYLDESFEFVEGADYDFEPIYTAVFKKLTNEMKCGFDEWLSVWR